LLGAGAALGCATLLERLLPPRGAALQAAELLVAGSAGIATYYFAALLLRVAEVRQAFRDLLRR
jgi:hypothetical protein